MNNKMIEILIRLLGHLKDHELDDDSLNDFSEGLILHGYDEMDVSEAVNWFLEKLNTHTVKSTEIVEQNKGSVRVLHDFERMNIPPEVYGYLLKLKSMSVISGTQMEKILDYYLLISPQSMNESDINELIAHILFND